MIFSKKKKFMTRGDQAASKTATIREMTQSKILEVAKFEGSKPRKLRMESEIGSHSARSRLTEIKDRPQGTCRTRSVSPTPFKQPLPFELPLKKFNNIYSKVVTQLETVNNLSEKKSNEADNIFDLRRQLQRADEFAIRFSRNNLYETKRILNDIKKIMTPFSFENLSTNEGKTLGNKIMLGYQAASQSLQIYINYIKNPANIEVPEKICELVVLVTDLFLCCEQFCPSSNETNLGNHAIKICNQLVTMLKSKLPAGEYVDTKQENASKKKFKKFGRVEDLNKIKNFSMYETRPIGRTKLDCIPKKKFGVPYLFGNKQKKMKKKDERKARITHEIYTQKMSSRRRRSLGTKIVKFESFEGKDCERSESAAEKKLGLKKSKFFTPREVKSQDDDVETMVQTIDDEELPVSLPFYSNI